MYVCHCFILRILHTILQKNTVRLIGFKLIIRVQYERSRLFVLFVPVWAWGVLVTCPGSCAAAIGSNPHNPEKDEAGMENEWMYPQLSTYCSHPTAWPCEQKLCFEYACWHPSLWSGVAFKWILLSPVLAKASEPSAKLPFLQHHHTEGVSIVYLEFVVVIPSSSLWWIIEMFDLDTVQRFAAFTLRPEVEEAVTAWAEEGTHTFQHGGDLKVLLPSSAAVTSSRGHIFPS